MSEVKLSCRCLVRIICRVALVSLMRHLHHRMALVSLNCAGVNCAGGGGRACPQASRTVRRALFATRWLVLECMFRLGKKAITRSYYTLHYFCCRQCPALGRLGFCAEHNGFVRAPSASRPKLGPWYFVVGPLINYCATVASSKDP